MPDCPYTQTCYPDRELRLHLAEPEPIVTPPDVEMGLKYWREINATPNRWATFDASQFSDSRSVRVSWGHTYIEEGCNVFHERAIETILFTMIGDTVYVTRHTHF